MKHVILITGAAAVTVNAGFGGSGGGDWGWGNGDWSGNADCVKTCISDWSSPDSIISSACPTGTITSGPSKPTLVSCLESACPDWFPSSKWDSISSKVGDACSSWSSCKTEPGAKTYTLSYDDAWWSDKGWAPTKTADVVTFTGCAGDWDGLFPGGWPGWDGDWDDGKDGDKDDGWDDDKDGDGKDDDWKDGDWSDYCDDNGQWNGDDVWSSGYSYSCVSVTSTITDNGVISTVVAGSPTSFLAAAATTTGNRGGENGDNTQVIQTASPTVPPVGAAATVGVGMLAGAVVGVAMVMAI